MNLFEIVFWLSALFIFYTYAGYPLLLFLFTRLKNHPVKKGLVQPQVSVVLVVRNESNTILHRLQNLCQQDYPPTKMEILVVSDGSNDGTDALVKTFPDNRVRLISLDKSSGKAVGVNTGVAAVSEEIVVFADARQTFETNAISELVTNFADPAVGCVGGELVFLDTPGSSVRTEMGSYWKYEKTIRHMESNSGSVVGVSGCIYAIRKILYQPLPEGTILDDVLTPMNVVRQGYRVIFEPAALAYDIVSKDASQEWKRKVRTLSGNWQILSLAPWLLLPWQNAEFFRFISHKICRLCIPLALLLLLISSLLSKVMFYNLSFFAQCAFYAVVLLASITPGIRKVKIIGLAYFFVLLNTAVVLGFWRWLQGESAKVWGS